MHVRKGFKGSTQYFWHREQHVQNWEHLPKEEERRGQPMSHHNKLGPRGTGGPREEVLGLLRITGKVRWNLEGRA